MVPEVALTAEIHAVELARVLRRVAKQKHHRLAVSESAFSDIEDFVRDAARFIEDVERGRVTGVLAGEGF